LPYRTSPNRATTSRLKSGPISQQPIAIPAAGFHQNGQAQIGIHAAMIKTAHNDRTRHTQ
jgi:hypothetical protein